MHKGRIMKGHQPLRSVNRFCTRLAHLFMYFMLLSTCSDLDKGLNDPRFHVWGSPSGPFRLPSASLRNLEQTAAPRIPIAGSQQAHHLQRLSILLQRGICNGQHGFSILPGCARVICLICMQALTWRWISMRPILGMIDSHYCSIKLLV